MIERGLMRVIVGRSVPVRRCCCGWRFCRGMSLYVCSASEDASDDFTCERRGNTREDSAVADRI